MANIKVGPYLYSESDCIGKGNFGKVYKGKSLATGSIVAIKVIHIEPQKQAMKTKMINNEVEALKKSKSEYVVQFNDFIIQGNSVYIVTEFCNQKDLRYYLSKHKILDEKKAVEFLKQIVSAFRELCKQQVLHRDLKPANIMMNNGRCKIGDFGFAKSLDFSLTDYNAQMVSIVGTPLYMSPQLLDKQKYTTKSDIWSLGIIFYEMLFGKVPWVGKDPVSYSKNIRSQPLQFDFNINNISAESQDFLQKCLKVLEEDRMGWNELFEHPLVAEEDEVARISTKDDSHNDVEEVAVSALPHSMIKNYESNPLNPSGLVKVYEGRITQSRMMSGSQVKPSRTNLDQKLKQVDQVGLSQSTRYKTIAFSKMATLSVNDDGGYLAGSNNGLKSNLLINSRDPSPTTLGHKISDQISEEFKKIETPLLAMKNKILSLSSLFSGLYRNEDYKELIILKFRLLITISKLINIIFKSLSIQVLTKKIKSRSPQLPDYLESDNYKRLVAFAETEKKRYEEMWKVCSRKLFELKLSSNKEKDEILEYYHEIYNEVEEQVLVEKILDLSNQMLYQFRFNTETYSKQNTVNTQINQSVDASYEFAQDRFYLEGLLSLFGDDSVLEAFKYDRLDDLNSKILKLKHNVRQRLN